MVTDAGTAGLHLLKDFPHIDLRDRACGTLEPRLGVFPDGSYIILPGVAVGVDLLVSEIKLPCFNHGLPSLADLKLNVGGTNWDKSNTHKPTRV